MVISPARRASPDPLPIRLFSMPSVGDPVTGGTACLHPGRWRWLRAMAWMVLVFFLTAAAFGLPLQAAVDQLPPGTEPCSSSDCRRLRRRPRQLRPRRPVGRGSRAAELAVRPALPGLAVGAALGLAMMAVLMGALVATGAYDITVVGATPAWTGLGLALQAAVTEELWMRALLLRLLWRAFGPVPAFIVAALVFGALHLANPGATPLAGATVVMAGLMFCALYALTGRLWVPIGVHLAWNLAQGYLFGATVSGNNLGGSILLSTARPEAPPWLTGGTFGPEASVLALILVSTVTVGALGLARRTGRFAARPHVPAARTDPVSGPVVQREYRQLATAKAGLASLGARTVPARPAALVRKPSMRRNPRMGRESEQLISSSRRSASSRTRG